jgi:hypothetical protein
MAAVSSPRTDLRRSPPWTWQQWLVLGVCFGLGHGITQRLLELGFDQGSDTFQSFGVKSFPGQSLETLRSRHGVQAGSLLVDFVALEREKRSKQEQAESEKRRAALEEDQRTEQERLQREAEHLRLDALDRTPREEAAPAPSAPYEPEPAPTGPEPAPEPPAADLTTPLPPLPEAPPAPSPAGRP